MMRKSCLPKLYRGVRVLGRLSCGMGWIHGLFGLRFAIDDVSVREWVR
jgi:hypothetical protein